MLDRTIDQLEIQGPIQIWCPLTTPVKYKPLWMSRKNALIFIIRLPINAFNLEVRANLPAWASIVNECGMNCCVPATRFKTSAPLLSISNAKSVLNAAMWARSNSPTSCNPTASKKTGRSAACACARHHRPNPLRHHHSHHQIPTANNRAVNARWSACANSKLHSTELPYYYHYLSWPSGRSTAQHQKLSTQKVRQNPRTPTRQTLHSPIQGYSPFQPESA